MRIGPHLNNNRDNYSSQDSLGIESVVASMQERTCPIVNTVTARAFYWAFLVWNYYDFYLNSGIEKNSDKFSDYARRQDFFFVLATLLSRKDNDGLGGIRNVSKYINEEGPFSYDDKYLKASLGGMDIYYT